MELQDDQVEYPNQPIAQYNMSEIIVKLLNIEAKYTDETEFLNVKKIRNCAKISFLNKNP